MLTEGLLFLVRLSLSSVHHYFNPVPPPLSQILTLLSPSPQLKLLLSAEPDPPPISPLFTRAARKRRRELGNEEEAPVSLGAIDVAMVTGWFSDALHEYLTRKYEIIFSDFQY